MPIGILSKFYTNTGTYEAPVWTEVPLFSDLTVNPTWDTGDSSTRGSRVKTTVKTMLGLDIGGKILKKPNHPAYEKIMNAVVGDDILDVLILDGKKEDNGVRGWRVDVQVTQANEDQGLGSVIFEDLKFEPTLSDNQTKAVLVSGGNLTYAIPGGTVAFG